MKNKDDHLGRKGNRLEGRALAASVAHELNGMMLAQAWVTARSANLKLNVNKIDGLLRQVTNDEQRDDRIMVDVVSGFIRKSWAG